MPFEAILHARRSAEMPAIARDAGQAVYKCPEPLPARAATSRCDATSARLSVALVSCDRCAAARVRMAGWVAHGHESKKVGP
eukprot:6203624-Pleurochrysis_carterae.AAC.3